MSEAGPTGVRELVLRARGGDRTAFGELVRRYEAAVFRLALRITGRRADAEDAGQEAFLRAWQALGRFDPGRPFGPWLLKIAANRALTAVERRRAGAGLEEAAEVAEDERDAEAGDRLRTAMSSLAPLDRAILSLRYEDGLSVAQVAETLDILEGAAKVRLFRARERLMGLLEATA
ncbi:MAG: sigma-70 family RNA polymerase sigma factor [Elusimicrobia bacterium]|nr:sigma-70 family RNA polymerase sigma factor [Elusimicrobiota bacterium]